MVVASLADVYLVRHGETAWSISGQHTGLTDLPLTANGENQARWLQNRLLNVTFTMVFTSPLLRARRTCEIAGYASKAEVDPDLLEWNYGDYEGKKRSEILKSRPDWIVFRDGCPNGEASAPVAARADRVIARVREVDGRVALFSSGHFLRTLIARWLGLAPTGGALFALETATLTILGFDHDSQSEPLIRVLNEVPR
jgi:broad specificity phosphatase PhoE